jgi:GMC oxidoreductase
VLPAIDGRRVDYVIVGAGLAGCVLPNRLTEDRRHSVLLLEYGGGDRSVFVRVPSALSIPMNRARYNWGYEIEPEPHLNGRRRAERCWADRHRSTGSFTSAAISRIRGIGGGRRLRDTQDRYSFGRPNWFAAVARHRPRDRRGGAVVAGFMGTMNLIPGTVGNGVLAAGPVRLTIAEAGGPCTLAIGAEVLLPVSEGGFPGGCGG